MTMDANELRAACEAAGLLVVTLTGEPYWRVLVGEVEGTMPAHHPALPAYVASLLVTRVRERQGAGEGTIRRGLWESRGMPLANTATDAQRIRAAMEVLNAVHE